LPASTAKSARTVRGSIDKDVIVEAALRLLARDGIAGISTRLVADALGIAGPSLYWHFKDKRQLLDHLAEAMLAEAQPSPDPLFHEPDWRKWLEKAARAYRRAALSRRDAAQVLAGARPTGTHPQLNYPAMVARLTREGFAADKAPYVVWSLGRFALGWALSEQAAGHRSGPRTDQGFEYGLAALIGGFEKLRNNRASRTSRPAVRRR
jgi:TetR/AcrR family tetracycline transcriptional repressor